MYKLRIFEFLIILFLKLVILDTLIKITIFILEISLKLHLHTKYGWNNPNSRRFGLESPKLHFLPFLAARKFIAHNNIQIHVTSWFFIVNWFFVNASNNSLYQNQKQLQLPKKCKLPDNDPLNPVVHCIVFFGTQNH